jgi:archaemetzincin
VKFLIPHIIAGCIFLLYSCSAKRDSFLMPENEQKIIAIQPVESYDSAKLHYLKDEIGQFFQRNVIILDPISMAASGMTVNGEKFFNADSVLNQLQKSITTNIGEVIGITHCPIYIRKSAKKYTPDLPFYDEYLIGLADVGGKCCIVSDDKFEIMDELFSRARLRNAVLHEMGHNAGLDHCKHDRCIMSEKNGDLKGFFRSSDNYCDDCDKKLSRIHVN